MSIVRDPRLRLPIVLLIALGLRVAVAAFLYERLTVDVDSYLGIAQGLREGRGYSTPGTARPTAFRPPLYPLVLAGVAATVGESRQALGIAALHVLLGTATVGFTWAAGRRLGLDRAAWWAALIVAVDPLLLQYAALPMTETLCAFLAAALIFVLSPPPLPPPSESASIVVPPRRSNGRGVAVGIVFGLFALCRPTVWAYGGLLGLCWIVDRIRRTEPRQRLRIAFGEFWPVFVGVLVVVGPWLGRNVVVLGRPIFTTTHGGYTLLLGNNPVFYREVVERPWGAAWSGESLDRWQQSLQRAIKQDEPPTRGEGRTDPPNVGDAASVEKEKPPRSESETDRWMYRRALANIADQPGLFLRACGLRFLRFWNIAPAGPARASLEAAGRRVAAKVGASNERQTGRTLATAATMLIGVFYSGVFAFAAVGALRMLVRLDRRWRRVLLLPVAFTLVHLVFWTNTRMRAPLTPAVALLAVAGGLRSIDRQNLREGGAA